MKKLMIAAAIVCAAVASQAATVGWSCAGLTAVNGDAYMLFVYDTAQQDADYAKFLGDIKTSLSKGDLPSGALGEGKVANNMINVLASNSGVTLGEGTWRAFFVVFDSETPVAGTSNYAIVGDGGANMTKQVTDTTTSITLGAGNQADYVGDSKNWKSFGPEPVPEPTSAMLLLLGVAGLALRRKQA